LELALRKYHDFGEDIAVIVRNDFTDSEELYPSIFFRGEDDFEDWELLALERCGPRVLDIGAGVGSHGLVLQNRGHRVTALELLPGAVRIMRERGITDARLGQLEEFSETELKYDTILLLMNGSMLAGNLTGLEHLLGLTSSLLASTGIILMDSTDLRTTGDLDCPVSQNYAGELHYQLEFEGVTGEVFPQLFIDPKLLECICQNVGLEAGVIWSNKKGHYLVELKRG
jgi:SAM-dependent methyltransferase|tara:strand:+ start:1228 stop:1911 length:684 start_codon:yes stop_codon:yes gene_type:complete